MESQPLVSIIAITYNSAQYVLETLESAKAQTYQNIELIISDDGSNDQTVEICKTWLENNKDRFVHTELITVRENTGIPANCNRGVKASNGEWIKLIAGDDILKEDCIESNLKFLFQNKEIEILQTQSLVFLENFKQENILSLTPKKNDFFNSSSEIQHKMLQKKNYIIAPSIIFSRNLYKIVGGFDERFRLFEDITFWLNATNCGSKVHFLEVNTVYYRMHNETSEKASKPYMRKNYANELIMFRKTYTYNLKPLEQFKYMLRLKLIIILDEVGLNNNNFLSRVIYRTLNKFLR
jgi:glycosyltransferase involved in cell wall biosynthesis